MSDITLEWFFQIPGLFITIGVLLILIALLVLIIGGSKAKNKKQEDLSLVDDVQESAVNQVESVNVLEPSGVNYLNGANNLNNNLENNGLVNNDVGVVNPTMISENAQLVGNGDNIAPAISNPLNIVTPVNVNENVIVPQVEHSVNVENIDKANEGIMSSVSQPETVIPSMAQPVGMESNISSENLNIQESVVPAVAVDLDASSNTNELADNNQTINNRLDQEVTMSPIFREPVAPIENITMSQAQEDVQKKDDIIVPVSGDSNVSVNNNINDDTSAIIKPIPPVISPVTMDFIEPIEPVKQQVPVVNKINDVPTIVPDVNNTVNPAPTVENSEVEEIL